MNIIHLLSSLLVSLPTHWYKLWAIKGRTHNLNGWNVQVNLKYTLEVSFDLVVYLLL